MDFFRGIKSEYFGRNEPDWLPGSTVEIEQKNLLSAAEKICQDGQCRYPLLALRVLIYIIADIDANGRVFISARQLSKKLDAHYDTVTKCLKYLREINVLHVEK